MGDEGVRQLTEAGYPVVVIGRTALAVPSVRADEENGAYLAVQHLLALGHRRIGIVGDTASNPATAARLSGCRRAFADAGRELDESLLVLGPSGTLPDAATGRAAAERLAAASYPPTAIFALGDAMALGVLRGASHPVSVVGFGDTSAASLVEPELTSVRTFGSEVGQRAARTLLGVLAGEPVPPDPVVLPCRLVVRASTAPLPSRA